VDRKQIGGDIVPVAQPAFPVSVRRSSLIHRTLADLKLKAEHPSVVINSIGMKLVCIQPGMFIMGSPADEAGRGDDETQHPVTISKKYYIGATQVTQSQWKAVMGNNPSCFQGDECPVEGVSWDDAADFCYKLSAKEGKRYRLPTEAEWEYSCRAGTGADDSLVGKLDDHGWSAINSGDVRLEVLQLDTEDQEWLIYDNNCRTHPVAQKKPNAWGLYDMHGNVLEWCSDWYGDYPDTAVKDPSGPPDSMSVVVGRNGFPSGAGRVLRGGSYQESPQRCRTASRSNIIYFTPNPMDGDVGFRVAMDGTEYLSESFPRAGEASSVG